MKKSNSAKPNNKPLNPIQVKSTITMSQRDWTVIFNILVNGEYKAGDGELVMGILRQIQPHVAVATNITPEESAKQIEAAKKEAEDKLIVTKKSN